MSNYSTNHRPKGKNLPVRRPKSKLAKRRNKAKARARREARRAKK
ncbi:MAG TPA: hypothetical protein VJB60_01005 [Candidatus Peribacterales bacterium]|nr:hypothetical protein [Candidatus Peribacterales bacterium]